MKRLISLVLVLLLMIPVIAYAEDYSAWETEQLRETQNAIRNELLSRELIAAKDTILIDQDGVKLYLTGDYEFSGDYLRLNCVLINNTDKEISIDFEAVSINGWEVYGSGTGSVSAGKKKKDTLTFNAADAEVTEYEQIEEIEIKMYIYDSGSWERIATLNTVTLAFGK